MTVNDRRRREVEEYAKQHLQTEESFPRKQLFRTIKKFKQQLCKKSRLTTITDDDNSLNDE